MKIKPTFLVFILTFTFYLLPFTLDCYAKEINIIFSGEAHAMLYPCHCPLEPDGGVARRATLIKELKAKHPCSLLVDSGSFFSGGMMDQYTQNTALDTERTMVQLRSMELMGYDAVALGDDEFNFGKTFLESRIKEGKLPYLSSNVGLEGVRPYMIKEVCGVRVGIFSVLSLQAMSKADELKFLDPKTAVRNTLRQLKEEGAQVTVLLSHLGEDEDVALINEVPGIDILVCGHSRIKEELSTKIGSTMLVRASWQGRRLGRISFDLKDGKISDLKVEEHRLSDKVADDPAIVKILPRCFADGDCRKEGFNGKCLQGSTLKASCEFTKPSSIKLTVITAKDCATCDTQRIESYLRKSFPGLNVTTLTYPDKKAKDLLKKLDIKTLPVFLLGKEVSKEEAFAKTKQNFKVVGDYYYILPELSGIAYFTGRERLAGKLDLFLSLYTKDADKIIDAVKPYKAQIHFSATFKDGEFSAERGAGEVEEYLRAVCVKKYLPEDFNNYITCRAKKITSAWWDDCLQNGADKVRSCARADEGASLLKENIKLNEELKIMFGPAYLVNNQEIFSSKGALVKDDLKKIIGK